MPYVETVDELAEALATMLGIYNHGLKLLPDEQGHADDCTCRQCWCGAMERRIRAAVANEQQLTTAPRG